MPAPDGIEMCPSDVGERHLKEKAPWTRLPLLRSISQSGFFSFMVRGKTGGFRRKLPRGLLLKFLANCHGASSPWRPARRPITGSERSRLWDTAFGWCRRRMSNPLSNGRKMMRLMQKPLRKRRAGPQCGSSNPRHNISRRERWSSGRATCLCGSGRRWSTPSELN